LVLVLTTLLLVWAGLGDNTKRVYRIDLGLAIFFIGSFFVGLLLSLPIVIHNGRLGTEEIFGTFSPRILDLGPKDFYFHGVLGTLLLFFTVYWFARYYKRGEA
jgi:hypothetical protein